MMDKQTRLSKLAAIISDSASEIDSFLVSRHLPNLTFDADGSSKALLDTDLATPRQALLEATDELHALLLGPVGLLTTRAHNYLIGLHAVYRYKLASCFPEGRETATFEEISENSGLEVSMVKRILRQAMTYHIFQEPQKGLVTHTATSKLLATNPAMLEWVGMVAEEMWPAATKAVDAMARWPGSEEPNQTGFNIAHSTDATVFGELIKWPERQSRFSTAMAWSNTAPGLSPKHIIDNYDWPAHGGGTVVDIGGSHGSVSIAVAQAFPDLTFIVQDQAEVVDAGMIKLPPNLKDRVRFMVHDFFKIQPIKDADVYYFRWIFHDWSDRYATQILRALVPALKHGAKILISDYVVPEPGSISAWRERLIRGFDLSMLEFHNGKERDNDDWSALFKNADARFEIVEIKQPRGSTLGIVEVVWTGRMQTLP